MKLRMLVIVATLAVTLATVAGLAAKREQLISSGQVLFLALAPVDPRSLLQGDYMELRYAVAAAVPAEDVPLDGALVVSLDERQIATLARRYVPGSGLAADEHLLRYRLRLGTVSIGAESFFFPEGQAARYAAARYAELRVAADGTVALVGLRDAQLKDLAPD